MATVAQQKVAQQWGKRQGCSGNSGGWIYAGNQRTCYQGWAAFYDAHKTPILDELTKKYTAFQTFMDLVTAPYTPTLRTATLKLSYACTALADAYDQYMMNSGSEKRAQRG